MPDIRRGRHASKLKSLRHKSYGKLWKDIDAIFTLTGKKNFLGHEIIDIKNREVNLKKDSFHDEQIRVVFFLIWGTCKILDKINMCFGVCKIVWAVLDMTNPLPSPICNSSLPR